MIDLPNLQYIRVTMMNGYKAKAIHSKIDKVILRSNNLKLKSKLDIPKLQMANVNYGVDSFHRNTKIEAISNSEKQNE